MYAGKISSFKEERTGTGKGRENMEKKINQEMIYKDLCESIDNLWSVFFTTGYLTQRGETY